ncbi:DNA-methyltransferase [Pectobacterium carotovorum]|uniref:DNA-methyltransferase n=1 Tax=Pectobacterium carotovorum TaxID=554 RepID=UPI00193D5F43|nr:site-specific DNA-methyltransferase [Pectobacterium carotovorum]QRN39503.1 site-specific DNA-methyltransferase [Pectobacterium carotovorum]
MAHEFAKKIVEELFQISGILAKLPIEYELALSRLGDFLADKVLLDQASRRRHLLARLNWKFRVNQSAIALVYAHAAKKGITFNFHQKAEVQYAFDSSSLELFENVLRERAVPDGVQQELVNQFNPASEEKTISAVRSEYLKPSKMRNERDAGEVRQSIALSAIAALAYSYADEQTMHSYFDSEYVEDKYNSSFWLQLRNTHPELYSRDRALDFINVNSIVAPVSECYREVRAKLLAKVVSSYEGLNNHGYLTVWLEPTVVNGKNCTWELASDLILFAEKFVSSKLEKGYFRPDKIKNETQNYIPWLRNKCLDFDSANEGFTYRDTFVCANEQVSKLGSESLFIIFQKNMRDETIVPCPACRSSDVGGNSYPSLGVKSWECRNLLCPDKSKYNRGKRYSFKSLLMQEAIYDDSNEIPVPLVRSWSRDVQIGRNAADALEMAIRFYSLCGDTLWVWGEEQSHSRWGRNFIFNPRESEQEIFQNKAIVEAFWNSSWFDRYIVLDESVAKEVDSAAFSGNGFNLIHGDARSALSSIENGFFDAAITSPPYYNAREYAQWPNIYCHMYDMYNIALEVSRVLKEGGLYLYNVFDYFDNEKTLAHSAMGNKRVPLSAYTVDAFRRAGLSLIGSITWDKGEIEGKRGFNAGNYSPYYQAPFNCWEHILVFQKLANNGCVNSDCLESFQSILSVGPVIKMVGGQNIHGHTAPFPEELPKLLARILPRGAKILDPFAGSGTTARALAPLGMDVTCIERDANYCALARRLFDGVSSLPAPQFALNI